MNSTRTRTRRALAIATFAAAAAIATAVPASAVGADDHPTLPPAAVFLGHGGGSGAPHDDHPTGIDDDHPTVATTDRVDGGRDDHPTGENAG
ncbi:hypothetical protein [Streptomyces albireticuli]|uniref:Uncharacterized protein n=1 Tax=Streptomyces albireticuli TaxID=1940 RepID=A0A2A2D076_9ACTN|nr:hypothetical protein [Streptomyces albireticuli]MCD9144624.1 hypothetical protein [Streptomyces albireticuli]MCD9165372.1 hypothetical protein [Streptomyces albireticuli]MCD9193531.1 hypothetical protein [Streptomyces albireticuli]PAU44740.1 hypothetical protein CK936_33295 [Streptomyces albireticuli]